MPIFDSIRNKTIEKPALDKITLSVDDDAAFDYEACMTKKFTKQDYLNIIMKEAKDSH